MRNFFNLLIFALLIVSCKSNETLDSKTALELIQKGKEYPKVVDYEIYTADPQEAKRMLDLGSEKSGMLKVQLTQASKDIGEPFITFTDKASLYLLPQTADDKGSKVQRVKVAEEVVNAVTNIDIQEDGKSAVVTYEISFKNLTPFSELSRMKLDRTRSLKANLIFDDKEWSLVHAL
ncbi:hypothetical protein ABIB40_002927 [Pedobacter sp. UYP30]|uniref:hypothetical protein n=1 Tax=Pedobacter sp. UYP30 TaxID=1756400 RepID=UPI0033977FF6